MKKPEQAKSIVFQVPPKNLGGILNFLTKF